MTLFARFLVAAFACLAAGAAQAHPHVWVTVKSDIVYGADGAATGIRHAWTFDDMFSTFATQGLAAKEKGKFTREELAPLAEVNVSSLKDFEYFTKVRLNGKNADVNEPVDYYLEFTNGILTLHFTLPLKTPAKAQSIDIEIYDSMYFIDLSFAEKEPVRLVGAPAECKLAVMRPGEKPAAQQGEAFFNNLTPGSNFGAQFTNKIAVKCP